MTTSTADGAKPSQTSFSVPELSVIVPVHNSAQTLRRTFDSLQRFSPSNREHVEIILVDDGSTDHSLQLMREMAAQALIPCQVIARQHAGVSATRNAGIAVARGKWLMFLDADDEVATDLLEHLPTDDSTTSVSFSVQFVRSGKETRMYRPVKFARESYLDRFTAENPFPICGLIFRRSLVEAQFDPDLTRLEDWCFWIRNPQLYEKMLVLPEVSSSIVHISGTSASSSYRTMGAHRQQIAEQLLEELSLKLTRYQANNLQIQAAIGALQAREKWLTLGSFRHVPCNLQLYLKLSLYQVAATANIRLTPYR